MTSGDGGVSDSTGDVEPVAQRVRQLSDQVIAQAKSNGLAWLEGHERVLRDLLDLEEQAANASSAEWAKSLAIAHANFVRDTSEVLFGTLRSQLRS